MSAIIDKILSQAEWLGLDQAEVESLAKLPKGRISKWKSDQGEPSARQAFRIAQVLGVTVDWLVDDTETFPPFQVPTRPTIGEILSESDRAILDFVHMMKIGKEQAIRAIAFAANNPWEFQDSEGKNDPTTLAMNKNFRTWVAKIFGEGLTEKDLLASRFANSIAEENEYADHIMIRNLQIKDWCFENGSSVVIEDNLCLVKVDGLLVPGVSVGHDTLFFDEHWNWIYRAFGDFVLYDSGPPKTVEGLLKTRDLIPPRKLQYGPVIRVGARKSLVAGRRGKGFMIDPGTFLTILLKPEK
ncbi:helix-turn-helix domain-containing protein [Singulisphaera rosea]